MKLELNSIGFAAVLALAGTTFVGCNFPYGTVEVESEAEGLGGNGENGAFEATVVPSGLSYSPSTLNLTAGTPMVPVSPMLSAGNQITFSAIGLESVPGVQISTVTGTLFGTPTASVSGATVVVVASNSLGMANANLTINVTGGTAPPPPPTANAFTAASKVIAGGNSTIVVEAGSAFVAGQNQNNNLNHPFDGSLPRFTSMDTTRTFVDGATSASHGCMIDDRGGLVCFGLNRYGELGVSATGTDSRVLEETPVPGLSFDVDEVEIGHRFTCALQDGDVICFGQNTYGQLGIGGWGPVVGGAISNENRDTPVQAYLRPTRELAVGGGHVCVIRDNADRSVLCWGRSNWGQVGSGTTVATVNYAQAVQITRTSFLDRGRDIAAGKNHTCAVVGDGINSVYCWGDNVQGQLGIGNRTRQTRARRVSGLPSGVTKVAAGTFHTCAIDGAGGDVYCWGDNFEGQLGNGTSSSSDALRPVRVSGLDDAAVEISAGDYHTCATLQSGAVRCWGKGTHGQLGNNDSSRDQRMPVAPVKGSAPAAAISFEFDGPLFLDPPEFELPPFSL